MTIADIYCRKSSEDDGRSTAGQEDECRADVAEQGWSVGRVFADPDRSASRFARKSRENYAALLERIESGACDVIVLWEGSRGSRNLTEWSTLLDLCRQRRIPIRIKSHDRTYDLAVRRDWRTLAGDGVDSADESEKISERTQRGKRQAAVKGLPSGPIPYGYTREYDTSGRLTAQPADPATSVLVREVFLRVAEGDPLAAIARDFTAAGHPAPKGGAWQASTVRWIATNRRYIGRSVHLGQDVGPGISPPLVDVATFDRAVSLVTDSTRRTQRGSELRYVLAGVPLCGKCRVGRLETWHDTRGVRRYQCKKCHGVMIVAEPLDDLVERAARARLSQPDGLELFIRRADGTHLAEARRELDELEAQHSDAIREAGALRLSVAALAGMERDILPRIERVKRRMRTLALPQPLAELAGVDVDAEWPRWPVRKRRGIIAEVVDLVVGPAVRGRAWFDPERLNGSRWVGDERTWGEL